MGVKMDSVKYHKKYWDKYANEKDFVISLQYEKFTAYVKNNDKILDVGCGYGRTLNELYHNGYKFLNGVDISKNIIERGLKQYPYLNLKVQEYNKIPYEDSMFDTVVLISVLTCIIGNEEQDTLIREIKRVLKPKGVVCISDFIINKDERNLQRYNNALEKYGVYGAFELSDGGVFRHHSIERVGQICSNFQEVLFEEKNYKTMNGNDCNGFYYIGRNIK